MAPGNRREALESINTSTRRSSSSTNWRSINRSSLAYIFQSMCLKSSPASYFLKSANSTEDPCLGERRSPRVTPGKARRTWICNASSFFIKPASMRVVEVIDGCRFQVEGFRLKVKGRGSKNSVCDYKYSRYETEGKLPDCPTSTAMACGPRLLHRAHRR